MSVGRWLVFGFAVAMLGMGLRAPSVELADLLPEARSAGSAGSAAGFAPNAVYPSTSPQGLPSNVTAFGSWLGGDGSQGRYESTWYDAERRKVSIYIVGYPNKRGNELKLIVRRRDGSHVSIVYKGANPGETWSLWNVDLPHNARYARVQAIDGSATAGGWLGVSVPVKHKFFGWKSASWAWLRLIGTTCLALCLLYGPGLIWLECRKREPHAYAVAALIGPLSTVALGLACWVLGGLVPAAWIARVGAAGILAWLVYATRKFALLPPTSEWMSVVRSGGLLVAFAVTTANISYGPTGELYGGSISRTLAVGGHADSRISFHVVQIVANHLWPFEEPALALFEPWSFTSRGPFAGILAAPIVLSAGAQVPIEPPDYPWKPFDAQGFAAYRIALIALASLAAWGVFGVLSATASTPFALLAVSILQLSPFFVHELYFTWPKLFAAGCVLASFALVLRARTFWSGVVLAFGYLVHPLAILSAPFLMLWALARRKPLVQRFRAPAALGVGIAATALPWVLLGRLYNGKGGLDVFVRYLVLADNQLATVNSWLWSRWQNFGNTFLPFHMFLVDEKHESINSIFGPSDGWIHYGFLYWNTLPFALGLPAFVALIPAWIAALRRTPAAVFCTFFGPALLLVIYWGAASSGLMRHCGHVLFVSAVALGAWSLAQPGGHWRTLTLAWIVSPAFIVLRALDLFWATFANTLHNHMPALDTFYGLNDWLSLVLATGLLGCACWSMFWALRDSNLSVELAAPQQASEVLPRAQAVS